MTNVSFLDLHSVNAILDEDIRKAFNDVLDAGWYILGNKLQHFEEMLAADLYARQNEKGYVVGCNSGTDAIVLSLLASDIGSGDEVITVSHTAIPTVTAIVLVGAIPVFVDIDKDTWVMDINRVAERITAKTKAIIPVHLYGNMVDVLNLREILSDCGREDITIIEDVAQAQGSYLNGLQAGTLGDFGAFSFYPSKNIGALGDGGAVSCRTEANYQRLLMLRNYGQKDRYNALISHGVNSRLDELQAGILSIKLKCLHEWNRKKSQMMNLYRSELTNNFIFQTITTGCEPAWHLCVIAFESQIARDTTMQALKENGVQTLIHYPTPTHKQQAFVKFITENDNLKNTELLTERILSIPLNIALQPDEQKYVIDMLKRAL